MKYSINYAKPVNMVTLSLEDIFREYMSNYEDILWDMFDDDGLETAFCEGIKALRTGDRDKILKMFMDGESPVMLGNLMAKIETWHGLDNYPDKGTKQPFILVITNSRKPTEPIVICGEDVNF